MEVGFRSSWEKSGLNLSVSIPFKIGLMRLAMAIVCLLFGPVPKPSLRVNIYIEIKRIGE